jgi:hypothetical protein
LLPFAISWRSWKTPKDAIAWAKTQLPEISEEQLQREFDSLNPTNGKKAPAWVERVSVLKDF